MEFIDQGGKGMELKWHDDIHGFLEQTLDSLEQDEAMNNLMLGVALRLKEDPTYYEAVECVTVRDRHGLLLAGLMTVPERLMVYSPVGVCDAAIRQLAAAFLAKNLRLPGVVGPKGLAEAFAAIWRQQTDSAVVLDMHMRVYELREVNCSVIGEGFLRPMEEQDLEFVPECIAGFMEETSADGQPDLEKCAEIAARCLSNQSLFLWEHDGKVVSMAAKTRPTRHSISISLVYTPKDLRGRGYATSCVSALSQKLLDSGYERCSLFTDLANPTSNSIYQKIGYRPVGDFDGYFFRPKSQTT